MEIGMLYTRIRIEEKMILREFRNRGIQIQKIDERNLIFGSDSNWNLDILLDRSMSNSRAIYATRFFENHGIRTINRSEVIRVCGDKMTTSLTLMENEIQIPQFRVAFAQESALQAIEEIGYPVVLKPVFGSWGRLLARINDRDSAEAILEHKQLLGNFFHSIFYMQEYIEKNGRDVRAFVVGNETIAAIYRNSEHWITNTARGAAVSNCPVTEELNEICLRAVRAVDGELIAIDLFETEDGFLVNELNHTMEFRNSIRPTGVNIPGKIVDYVIQEAKR